MDKNYEDGMYVITSKGSSENSSSRPTQNPKKEKYFKIVEDIDDVIVEDSNDTMFAGEESKKMNLVKSVSAKHKKRPKQKNIELDKKHSSPFDIRMTYDKSSVTSDKITQGSFKAGSSSRSISKASLSKKNTERSKKVRLKLIFRAAKKRQTKDLQRNWRKKRRRILDLGSPVNPYF
jgi:hypothetical protein